MKKGIITTAGMLAVTVGIMYANANRDNVPRGIENNPENFNIQKQQQGTLADSMPAGNKVVLDTNSQWKNDSLAAKMKKDPLNNAMDDPAKKSGEGDMSLNKKLPDRALMKNDVMFVIRNGEEKPMEKEILFESGNVLTIDGTLKKKDGTVSKLKNGQYIALPPLKENKPEDKY